MQEAKKSIKIILVVIIIFSFIITASAADSLIPLGHTVGIKLRSSGAIIIDMSEGSASNPARAAGLAPGDVIMSVDGAPVHSNSELRSAVENSGGKSLTVEFMRDGKLMTKSVTPTKNEDGNYALGIWIRDRLAGIGTMTFLDAESGTYGALGHGITDPDSGAVLPFESGKLADSRIVNVVRGQPGTPGELCGEFAEEVSLGSVKRNTDAGIFGNADFSGFGAPLPLASEREVRLGPASIRSNISGGEVEEFSVEISRIYRGREDNRFLLLTVTDERLLNSTGGIVQGMSGSPIIQDGKLVGAVTHVLVNDPTRGYGIFIENMLDAAG